MATTGVAAHQPQLGMLALASLMDLMSVTTVSGTPYGTPRSQPGDALAQSRKRTRTLGGSSRLRGGAEAM